MERAAGQHSRRVFPRRGRRLLLGGSCLRPGGGDLVRRRRATAHLRALPIPLTEDAAVLGNEEATWLRSVVAIALVGGLVFYSLIVELSYVLDDVGVSSTATIGFVSAIASLATAIDAFTFPRLAGHGPRVTVPLAFVMSGIGLIALGLAPNPATIIAAAIVTGLGNGLLLPALVTWALRSLTFTRRGRGTGAWTAALFICPLTVFALSDHLGGLTAALAAVGIVALAMSGIARTVRT